ncbi:hypothetical protein WDW89_20775 [Deltaproteobacteria bacterium TL4]
MKWALLIKEIKDQQTLFGTILLLTGIIEGYAISGANQTPGFPLGSIIIALLPLLFGLALLPFVLSRGFTQEWRDGTQVLWLTLPLPRFYGGFAKVLSSLILALCVYVMAMSGLHYILKSHHVLEQLQEASLSGQINIQKSDNPNSSSISAPLTVNNQWTLPHIWKASAMIFFPLSLLLFSLVYMGECCRFMFRKYRFLVFLISTGVGFDLYLTFLPNPDIVSQILDFQTSTLSPFMEQNTSTGAFTLLYTIVVSLIFLGIGSWILEKQVEG